MAPTCGYTCPQCEGRGYTDNGEVCDWCSEVKEKIVDDKKENSSEQNAEAKDELSK